MTQTTSLCDLILSALAARWDDMSDEQQTWAIDRGYARRVDVEVECADAESWQSDWRSDMGGSWPTYTLTVSVDGGVVGDVDGWHFVGPWADKANNQSYDWGTRDDDGAYNGLPRFDGDDHPTIESGSNLYGRLDLPTRGADGRVLVYDELAIENAVENAAADADHGDAPSWEDVSRDDMEDVDRVYVIRKYRVEEVMLRRGGIAGQEVDTGKEDWHGRPVTRTEYCAEAWSYEGSEDVFETRRQAVRDLAESAQDEEVYDSVDDAKAALAELARARLKELDLPDGLTWGKDQAGIYAEPEGAEGDGARYHLDADQLALVCTSPAGWHAILDDLIDALGLRVMLDAARSWQEAMDAVVVERDPFVGLADSVAGGNCPAGTKSFAERLASHLGAEGEIGAARASAILALRDDPYTRRACRMAAHRLVTA